MPIRQSQRNFVTNALTLGEAHAIIAAAKNERDALLAYLCWRTGGRICEVLSLRPGDILDGETLRLVNEKNGEGAVKTCFVDREVTERLERYATALSLRAGDFIFAGRSRGKHLSRVMAWKILKKLAAASGVVKLRDGLPVAAWPHLFRHGAAVNMVRQGWPIPAIKDQLGHASLRSTDVYAKMFSEDRKAWVHKTTF